MKLGSSALMRISCSAGRSCVLLLCATRTQYLPGKIHFCKLSLTWNECCFFLFSLLLGIEMAADKEQCKNMMSYVAWEQLSSWTLHYWEIIRYLWVLVRNWRVLDWHSGQSIGWINITDAEYLLANAAWASGVACHPTASCRVSRTQRHRKFQKLCGKIDLLLFPK